MSIKAIILSDDVMKQASKSIPQIIEEIEKQVNLILFGNEGGNETPFYTEYWKFDKGVTKLYSIEQLPYRD
jgi:hypothetical protein